MILRLLLTALCLSSFSLWGGALRWMSDYSSALRLSKEKERPLLLFFTSSDSSGWGMKMRREILDSPAFAEKIAGELICLEIDFPTHKSLPSEIQKQNSLLKEKMEITELPRLVLLDPEEREIKRLGYCPEEGGAFAADLLAFVERDRQLTEVMGTLATLSDASLKEFYQLAQELKREQDALLILEKGLSSSESLFFILEKYRLLVEEGKRLSPEAQRLRDKLLQRDPTNTKRIHYSLALIDFQDRACHLDMALDPKEVIAPLEHYLARFGQEDEENAWRVEMMIAQFYLECDHCKTALDHAQTAYERAPKERKGELEHSLDYIRAQVSQTVSK